MSVLLEKLSSKKNFSDTEQVIANYVMENYHDLLNCSTRQLAKKTFTSSAAIVRFSQKLGFEGYTEFKTKFLAEMMQKKSEPYEKNITSADDVNMIIEKVKNIELRAIKNTQEKINPSQFIRAMNYIKSADYIDFYAMNNNLVIANLAAESFIVAHKYSSVHSSISSQYLNALNSPKNHLAFLISRTGENRMLIDIAKVLDKKSVPIVLITSDKNSTLTNFSKVIFTVETAEEMEELGPRVFLTGAKYVIDVLYALLMTRIDYSGSKIKTEWLQKNFFY